MRATLLFLHGWGYDSTLWRKMTPILEGHPFAFAERGYFGGVGDAMPDGPVLAVAQSFGAMRLLADPPGACLGLIAINGFDRFAAAPEVAGVPVRVLDRMLARFDTDPAATLADFRQRCGDSDAPGAIVGDALGTDLHALRDDDRRAEAAAFAAPILSIQGGSDPIMLAAMRDAVFGGAGRVERRTVPEGGHLLPLTHPEFCALSVLSLAERLA